MLIDNFESRLTREGVLEVELRGFCNTVARITPWSRGFETFEIRFNKAIEKPLWDLVIFSRQNESTRTRGTQRFFADIPAAIREQVRQFEFGQCAMLRWLVRYPEARDLCSGNPTLFWLLAAAIYDSSFGEDEIPSLLRQKQAAILGRIIKPLSPSTLRILRKVKIDTGDLREARTVILALKKPHIRKIVSHLNCVPIILLEIIFDNADLALPSITRLLAEKLADPGCKPLVLSRHISDTLVDIRRMAELLGIENPDQAIARCRSIEELNRLHERWVDRVNRDRGLWLNAGQHEWPEDLEPPDWFGLGKDQLEKYMELDWAFPDPPFPDSQEIRAIRSLHELIGEGRIQRNCVASHAPAILSRETFVYKVLSPHRATLELQKRGESWEIGELKLSCNREPGAEVENIVNAWKAKNSQNSSR